MDTNLGLSIKKIKPATSQFLVNGSWSLSNEVLLALTLSISRRNRAIFKPVTDKIRYSRNDVEKTMILPAKTRNGPSTWTMSKLGVNATVVFVNVNLLADIRPSNPQSTPPSTVVSGGYLAIGPDFTKVTMKIFVPGFGFKILCNDSYMKQKCIKLPSGVQNWVQNMTIPYEDGEPYQIWYTDPLPE
ncbi:hypothetical protein PRIPAC_90544 [Pristionchus pacificus]|uniref:Uncharacterized protein n=1 Tax=Pristionchus pacificus TaxID=54126 RepID=A0A2A6B6P5_PRIPA|nr:hypothetical protein PRIPAC_90544 [Pristionchus pacificus]|eukprot:PDM61538.1 hypothetical protein PRIPAC_50980 [Pristionchus pacificus]